LGFGEFGQQHDFTVAVGTDGKAKFLYAVEDAQNTVIEDGEERMCPIFLQEDAEFSIELRARNAHAYVVGVICIDPVQFKPVGSTAADERQKVGAIATEANAVVAIAAKECQITLCQKRVKPFDAIKACRVLVADDGTVRYINDNTVAAIVFNEQDIEIATAKHTGIIVLEYVKDVFARPAEQLQTILVAQGINPVVAIAAKDRVRAAGAEDVIVTEPAG
jgi:hypothetical protein